MKINNARKIKLKPILDGVDGCLCVAESNLSIPFQIKRTYFIYELANPMAIRGKHAHYRLEQVIFCLKGSFELFLDDGVNREKILMNDPGNGVYMGPCIWHVMDKFSPDCVILVLASDYFNEADYIRDYNEFLKICKNENSLS